MDSLYIIIPAYNEAANIETTIEEWYGLIEKYSANGQSRLVIINDGSRDNTAAIVESMMEKRPGLELINKPNGGHGSSIYEGYKYALEKGADYIFQTDSDGQTLATEFEQFYNAREEFDVQIGNRLNRQDGYARRLISKSVRRVLFLTFGVRVEDVNTPYRLMNRKSLELAFTYLPEYFDLTNIALTGIFAYMAKGRNPKLEQINMRFLPISFRVRQGGSNSVNPLKIIKMGLAAIRDLRKITSNLRK